MRTGAPRFHRDYFRPPFGSGLVEKANRKAFKDLYYSLPVIDGDLDVRVDRDDWNEMDMEDWETAEDMIGVLSNLSDYPLLDDDVYSEMEEELKDEAWIDTYRAEFTIALERMFHIDLSKCSSGSIDFLAHELMQELGMYLEVNPDDEYAHIDIDDLVEGLKFSTVAAPLNSCLLVCKHCLGKEDPDDCGLERQERAAKAKSGEFEAESKKFYALATIEATVAIGTWGAEESQKLKAIPLSSGLIININLDEDGFRVTHVGSGLSVVSNLSLESLDEAMEVGKKLLAITDWSRETEEIQDDTEVRDAVFQISQELRKLRSATDQVVEDHDEMIRYSPRRY